MSLKIENIIIILNPLSANVEYTSPHLGSQMSTHKDH